MPMRNARPLGLIGNWTAYSPYEIDGFWIQVSQNGLDKSYSYTIEFEGEIVASDRVDQYKWMGHNMGRLIIQPRIEELKRQHETAQAQVERLEAKLSEPLDAEEARRLTSTILLLKRAAIRNKRRRARQARELAEQMEAEITRDLEILDLLVNPNSAETPR